MSNIIPPTKPESKVYVAFEMISPEMADWLLNLDIIERELIIFEAYQKSVLSRMGDVR